jgi:hypothetical protein
VHPLQYRAKTTIAHVARIVAALTLVLALLSGIAPQGSLGFAAPVSECSMSCCIGKPSHAAGDCATVSCHVQLPGHDDSHDASPETQLDAAQPVQTTGDNAHAGHESHAQTASHDAHAGHVETQHAETLHASRTPETDAPATPETDASEASQPEAGQTGNGRRSVAAHASVAPPCPSECGMAAGSFGNNLRPRDAATLTQARRPRPPARVAALKHFSSLPRTSSDRRRLTPPRAPPAAL